MGNGEFKPVEPWIAGQAAALPTENLRRSAFKASCVDLISAGCAENGNGDRKGRMKPCRLSRLDCRGFTVLEIIASIAVIVILMTALALGLAGLMPLSQSKQAQTDIIRIQQSLEQYRKAFGEYPKKVPVGGADPAMETILFNALAGTLAPNGKLGNFPSLLDRMSLDFQNGNFPETGSTPALVSNAVVDPWGNPYRYRFDPDDASWENFSYVLFSAGVDGAFTDVTGAGQKNEGGASNQDNVYAE